MLSRPHSQRPRVATPQTSEDDQEEADRFGQRRLQPWQQQQSRTQPRLRFRPWFWHRPWCDPGLDFDRGLAWRSGVMVGLSRTQLLTSLIGFIRQTSVS